MPFSDNGHYQPSGPAPLKPRADSPAPATDHQATLAEIDLRDLPPPMDLLRANALLRRAASGTRLAFLTDDRPLALVEFKALSGATGNVLLEQIQRTGACVHIFQRR